VTAPLTPELADLAHAYGVSTSFTDWRGRTVEVAARTVTAVLDAMDVDTTDPSAALHARWLEPWRRMLPPCVVATAGEGRWVWMHVPHGDPADLVVRMETGGELPLTQVPHWVDPRQVEELQRPAHPLHPPAVAPPAHRRPVIERVAPQLPGARVGVGRRARHQP